jgi:hypothetical protein
MIRRTYDTSSTVLPCTEVAPIRIVKAPSLWTANPTATTTPASTAHTSQLLLIRLSQQDMKCCGHA